MSKVPELTPCVHDNREQTKRFRHLAARFLTALMIVGCSLPAAAFTVQYGDSDDLDQVIWQDTANPLSPGSEDAIRGGRMIRAVAEFPRNLRRIGPDRYRVRQGDSLARISQKFNVRISDLKRWNAAEVKAKYLQPGQMLTLYVDVMR